MQKGNGVLHIIYWQKKSEHQKKTINLPQVADKLHHIDYE